MNILQKIVLEVFILKKTSKIWYIILIIIGVFIIGFGIYYTVAKSKDKNTEEQNLNAKVSTELEYIEEKFVNLFNKMNNIEYENYKITVKDVEKSESNDKESGATTTGEEKSGNTSSSDLQSSGGSQGGDSQGGNSEGSNSSQGESSSEQAADNQMYELQAIGVLTQDSQIDWEKTKTEVENIYVSIPTITLDLYQTNVNQQDILDFNSKFDNLTVAIKNENKQETLQNLIEVYKYMPTFAEAVSQNSNIKKTALDTKLNIFQGYSKLDSGDWTTISNDIQTGIQTFAKLLTDAQIEEQKQYTINKIYVMINELKSASEKKDVEIFLIKYKNLIEELNNV